MIVKKAFQSHDCAIFEADNGVEGLAAATKERPGLIVLDITMPVMNGFEMLGRLKSDPELKNIPVIMLTADSGKDDVLSCLYGIMQNEVKLFAGCTNRIWFQ